MILTAGTPAAERDREFRLAVLGRTLDHLGRQTYKRRDIALIELVANCWDAGARNVHISVPIGPDYDPEKDSYIIEDDGSGMSESAVETDYLIVGRNRRESEEAGEISEAASNTDPISESSEPLVNSRLVRPIMGRKGIGKLAGFGIAKRMLVSTWKDGVFTRVVLDADKLRTADGKSMEIPLEGSVGPIPADITTESGTRITLYGLKHKESLELSTVYEALNRRFSRRVRGEMTITVNGEPLPPPKFDFELDVPNGGGFEVEMLPDGKQVRFTYGFTKTPIASKDLRGFNILVHEKTAQAPPFYFNVEGTASGQHGTKYLTGEIHADYLDDDEDIESDIVATDRQDIDWENENAWTLRTWGETLTRRVLREWANRKGESLVASVKADPGFAERIERLESPTQKLLEKQLASLGQVEANPDRLHDLADVLIRAYEYHHFHNVVDQIDVASVDPDGLHALLGHLFDWKVLESRAILEIVKGRLSIIEKFESMIVNDARETARGSDLENMHDLLAAYPWLINPEWQVLSEETSVTRQLRDWNVKDVGGNDRTRYDFLALKGGDQQLVVIEIKRSGHPIEMDEMHRLNTYREKLSRAYPDIRMMMIGSQYAVSQSEIAAWDSRQDAELVKWVDLHQRAKRYYDHYRALLEGDLKSSHFGLKEQEILQTRRILEFGAYRNREERARGLGPQDVNYETE